MTRLPETVSDMLARIQRLLDAGAAREAAELARKFGTTSMELSNAYGVALLRAGETAKAVEVYRSLCLGDGIALKPNLPVVLKANYATALLLARNTSGCLALLQELPATDPYVARLTAAIARWRAGLGWWKRFALDWLGADLGGSVGIDFPPGEPRLSRELRPAA